VLRWWNMTLIKEHTVPMLEKAPRGYRRRFFLVQDDSVHGLEVRSRGKLPARLTMRLWLDDPTTEWEADRNVLMDWSQEVIESVRRELGGLGAAEGGAA